MFCTPSYCGDKLRTLNTLRALPSPQNTFFGLYGAQKLNFFENHAKLSPLGTPSEVGINSKKLAHHSVCARKKWGTYRQTMKLLSMHAHGHVESFTYPQHDLSISRSRPRGM